MKKMRVAVMVASSLCGGAMGADGVWTNPAGGDWSDSANWDAGVIADGPGALARFNVPGGGTVTADTARTVGRIHFDSPSGNTWALHGGPVTLESSALPELKVSNSATVSLYAPFIALNGLRRFDNGTSRFYAHNVIEGEVQIETGTITARGDLLIPDNLYNAFTAQPAWLHFVNQSGPTFELYSHGTLPTFQAFTGTTVENIGSLVANNAGSGTARIEAGPLTGSGVMVLSGSGDIAFNGAPAFDGSFRVRNGAPSILPVPGKSSLHPAHGPTAHFDASRTDTFTFQHENGTNFITRWDSLTGDRYAAHDGSVTPDGIQTLPFLTEDALNGLPVVDFGPMFYTTTGADYRANGAYLLFNAEIATVRTAFIVLKSENFIFTTPRIGNDIHYHNGDRTWDAILLNNRGETLPAFRNGDATAWLNGVVVNPFSARMSGRGAFDVICFENAYSPANVGAFAYDRIYRFGGQVIAEAILYSRVLSADERQRTEDYLRAKWHNIKSALGPVDATIRDVYNENSGSASRELNIAPGASLNAGRVSGARVAGFAGGGKVTLERGGHTPVLPVSMKDATTLNLKSSGAPMPAQPAASPITGTTFHVDASRADTMTFGSDGRVLEWRDLTGNGRHASAPNTAANPAPVRVTNAINGLPYVDFGALNSGRMMIWNHTNTTIQTAFLVFADPGIDSWLLGDTGTDTANFHRGNHGLMLYTGWRAESLIRGQTFVNGRAVDPERTFLPKEPVVIAFAAASNQFARASAFACDRWVTDKTDRTGDQKLCEVVLYDRYLPKAERRAVEAWLMRKWLPTQPAGYALEPGSEAVGDLRVTADAGQTSTLNVEAGEAPSIGALSGTGTLEKNGEGTLKVASLIGVEGTLKLTLGAVEVAARALPEPFALPGGAAFHLDASDAGSVLCDTDGTSVTNLLDASGGSRSAAPAVGWPRPQRVSAALNNLPVIDFGVASNGCCLLWDAPVTTVRTVFWVIDSAAGGGMPLGTRDSADGTDFLRGNMTGAGIWNGGSGKMLNGATRIDGRFANGATAGFNGGWQVISVVTAERATASAFAADRFAGADAARLARTGGQRLAEVLVYDRALGDLERRDVEAYLNRKWFGRLPQGYAGADVEVAKLELAGGELRAEDADASITVRSLLGADDLVKTGDHTLNVYQAHDYAGRVVVSNGVLALRGTPVSSTLPQTGMLMHVDASRKDKMTVVEENGTNFVTRWDSLVGDRYAEHDGVSKRPYLSTDELNGMPVVDFGPFINGATYATDGAFLNWNQQVDTVKTVFMVLGSQAGGGFLVTSHQQGNFHRGNDSSNGYSVTAPLLGTTRVEIPACMRSADAFASIDGVKVNPFAAAPSGGYQTFCFQTDDTAAVTVGTFSRDRSYRTGGQRIAEFMIYDRVLSASERAQVEAYLQDKWFARAYADYVRDVPLADVHVGPDGVLSLTGETRSVAAVSGSGVISNGTLRVTDTLDIGNGVGDCATLTVAGGLTLAEGARVLFDYQAPSHDAVTVSGALTAEPGVTFAVRLPEGQTTRLAARVPVATFGTLEGAANLATWTVKGLPEAYTGALVIDGQTLYLDIRMKGLLLILK